MHEKALFVDNKSLEQLESEREVRNSWYISEGNALNRADESQIGGKGRKTQGKTT
jgi:hypothetical protein